LAGVYANFEPVEGAVSGEETISLTRKSRHLVITNDSSSNNLYFKFNASEDYGTLMPTETISLYLWTNTIYLNGNGNYRIWVYG